MDEKRASLEVIAPSVEEAVAKGLDDLGVSEDAVDVEVLDEGSRGLFGLGSRQARVRLTFKPQPRKEPSVAPETKKAEAPEAPAERPSTPEPVTAKETTITAEAEEKQVTEEEESTLRIARETVSELLEKMGIDAQVTSRYGEAEDARSRKPLLVDINGRDLSILIGPRAETLNALQYIAALIIGKELGRSVPLVVDVEGYRVRREQQLRQLARRMAEQAIKTGRRQILEPMPANERRLVHIELRNNPQVTTESVGEDPRRKVTIIPTD
jgi:spoIIIJ-associated protein